MTLLIYLLLGIGVLVLFDLDNKSPEKNFVIITAWPLILLVMFVKGCYKFIKEDLFNNLKK